MTNNNDQIIVSYIMDLYGRIFVLIIHDSNCSLDLYSPLVMGLSKWISNGSIYISTKKPNLFIHMDYN